jgi:uncharacterized integral membrane protein (TIGR00698 family)
MLIALAVGMVVHCFWSDFGRSPGVQATSTSMLRIGIALLGSQVTLVEIMQLGTSALVAVIGGVAITLAGGAIIGKRCGMSLSHSVLSAGAVAICGASAALAISSVLPASKDTNKQLLGTVFGVTLLSTLAMVIYPVAATALNFDFRTSGIFFGAAIHDVAQVAGAGYIVSDATAATAVTVKLMRVACLAPVIGVIWYASSGSSQARGHKRWAAAFPPFLVLFAILMVARSAHLISTEFAQALGITSRFLLICAVLAVGLQTSARELTTIGWRPFVVLTLQSLLQAIFVISVLCISF